MDFIVWDMFKRFVFMISGIEFLYFALKLGIELVFVVQMEHLDKVKKRLANEKWKEHMSTNGKRIHKTD